MIVKKFESNDDVDTWIPLDQCQDGQLYYIAARNSTLGIYLAQNKSFVISRYKFDRNYLFEEYHWDTGAPFGTVKPLVLIGSVPTFRNDKQKLNYLNSRMRELNGTTIGNDITEGHQFKIKKRKPCGTGGGRRSGKPAIQRRGFPGQKRAGAIPE